MRTSQEVQQAINLLAIDNAIDAHAGARGAARRAVIKALQWILEQRKTVYP